MGNVNWDGSMLYDLYDLMVASGLPAELSDIDVAGIVSNIPVDEIKDAIGEISAENIEDVAELVSLYLTKECYETQIAPDGETALDMVDTFNPDLILLDIMLPGIDGYGVCR